MTVQVVGRAENLLEEVTCKNCLAILKYAPVDVKSFKSRDYSGHTDIVKYLTCPSCEEKVSVK